MSVRVTVWNEYVSDAKEGHLSREIYPEGMHTAIAKGLLEIDDDLDVTLATLDMPDQGLPDDVLENTDVLVWWGHCRHSAVDDALVEKIHNRVLCGMGLIVLHSGHHSKIFRKLLGTTCNLAWREDAEHCRIFNVAPYHPITAGIGKYFELEAEETYTEYFDIPEPDELIFITWWKGGEVFRSGCTFHRGAGKIFYFMPGHETFPTYYNPTVLRVIDNAVQWAKPVRMLDGIDCPHCRPAEKDVYEALWPQEFGGEPLPANEPHQWRAVREPLKKEEQ